MKTRIGLVIAMVTMMLCLAGTAEAQRPWYFGVKAGLAEVDDIAFDTATVGGVLFGYTFWEGDAGSLAAEVEYQDTLSEGDLDLGLGSAEWEVQTLAAYAAYRSGGNFYFKGKLGYLDGEVEATGRAFGISASASESDSDVAAGVGIGWRLGENLRLELEYTRTFFEEDYDVLSFGVTF